MCARACGEMRQLLVRFGVSDGSFVAGGLPLPHLSADPPPPPLLLAPEGGRRGQLGSQSFHFSFPAFPVGRGRLQA